MLSRNANRVPNARCRKESKQIARSSNYRKREVVNWTSETELISINIIHRVVCRRSGFPTADYLQIGE